MSLSSLFCRTTDPSCGLRVTHPTSICLLHHAIIHVATGKIISETFMRENTNLNTMPQVYVFELDTCSYVDKHYSICLDLIRFFITAIRNVRANFLGNFFLQRSNVHEYLNAYFSWSQKVCAVTIVTCTHEYILAGRQAVKRIKKIGK